MMKQSIVYLLEVFLLLAHHTEAKIVGALVLPHGEDAFAPELVDFAAGSRELESAAKSVSSAIVESEKPDVIFLTTPHGLELTDNFLVYQNSHLSGTAVLQNPMFPQKETKSVSLEARTDVSLANNLVEILGRGVTKPSLEAKENGENAEATQKSKYALQGLLGFADSSPLPLDWGEIIPFSFLSGTAGSPQSDSEAKSDSGKLNTQSLPAVVVASIPTFRYNHSVEMIPELLELGGDIGDVLERSDRKVLWVVSADLAHTHLAEGPYGFCECAEPFDKAVEAWAASLEPCASSESDTECVENAKMSRDLLLVEAAKLQQAGAASCGFTGLVMLQGMLDHLTTRMPLEREQKKSGEGSSLCEAVSEWDSRVLANFHPTYFGMMVAQFKRSESWVHCRQAHRESEILARE
uniref:Extradiol ring-cleavage dioxygenase class III enzyme subunit B domain-containing protein n=1 Tax=Chromera velia CCMP2878 TaxID=1169474 RepID=A0A0G4FRF3_9ALVE|mmetsp:Transcript_12139/g.23472  ORF Transcript_12139/g.23472 Transcript_12139/m.23472 type:complete len:409 (-) Transcript_12139:72-1298(-)|eukprot:Cvel_18273.t1-p1 / transcript=Cvel_18273.t1 / gene=Cvel_18273 / organism=Chromera_velia_CCMP2878 / gene_product=Protein TTE1956, putative / transcript_product=Protein TTE1956, putative / location=Cvel_scaffold1505:20456-21679(+) / protein_length=408 / sequence_SO=supercontig / SO=protein_coding / is_pseudo=false